MSSFTRRGEGARRLSSVSGLYAYLVARGDTPARANPVPRGLLTRRQGGSRRSRTVPLVRVPRTLPRILSPQEADRLVGALRTHRDRAMVLAMLLAGLRRCEVLGLRFADVQVADRRLAVTLVDHDTAMSTASILVQEDTHYRSRTAQPTAAAHRTTASQAVTEHRTVGADLPGRQLECRRPEPPAPGPVTVPQL